MVGILFMIFAGIALFVGGFIIWNTFTMIVTQRSREIALMRAIGATRRQVLRSLLLEAIRARRRRLGARRRARPRRGQGPQGPHGRGRASACRARRCSSSRAPSWSRCWSAPSSPSSPRWSRLAAPPRCCRSRRCASPTPGAEKLSKRRAVIGAVAPRRSASPACWPALYGDAPHDGVRARPGRRAGRRHRVAAAGGPSAGGADRARRCGCAACPASWRSRTRCATRVVPPSTAAALMIGLTLVVSMSVFASSLKDSFGEVIGDKTNADLFVTAVERPGPGLQPDRRRRGRRTSTGVETVSASGWGRPASTARTRSYSAIDPATAGDLMSLDLSQGSLSDLGDGRGRGLQVRRRRATAGSVGDTVDGGVRRHAASTTSRSSGIYDSKGWITDNFVISLDAAERLRRAAAGHLGAGQARRRAPTRTRSRTPSRRPWPTTRTPRCSTRTGSRRRPAGSSTACSPSSR